MSLVILNSYFRVTGSTKISSRQPLRMDSQEITPYPMVTMETQLEEEGPTNAAGLTEQQVVESAFNGRVPWWNSGASHLNHALPKRHFEKLELSSLLEKLLDYKKTVTYRTPGNGTVCPVVDGEIIYFCLLLDLTLRFKITLALH